MGSIQSVQSVSVFRSTTLFEILFILQLRESKESEELLLQNIPMKRYVHSLMLFILHNIYHNGA